MDRVQKDVIGRSVAAAVAVAIACASSTANAQESAPAALSAAGISLYADARLVAVDGEQSWTEYGFGKLRFGGSDASIPGNLRVRPQFAEAGIVWQPRIGWALSGTVSVLAQGGADAEAGLSEAFLTYKPLAGGPVQFSARAGLMWPPVSLEHGGGNWATVDTITPSAINSWIGEEVKTTGLEVSARFTLGSSALTATLAGFDLNDTAGALLTFRGWALHDRKALVGRKQVLPPLDQFMTYAQPRYSHPVINVGPGVLKRPGYYAKLALDLPENIHLEAFHYDNNGDPEAVNADLEWGWRTRFENVGLRWQPSPHWELRAQGLTGKTTMGMEIDDVYWIEARFRAAYAMLTWHGDRGSVSTRLDLFGTRNHGSVVSGDDNEDGWAITVAARRDISHWLRAFAEFLHVESTRGARARAQLDPRQEQNQLQLALQAHW
jgi:hypothetical protein